MLLFMDRVEVDVCGRRRVEELIDQDKRCKQWMDLLCLSERLDGGAPARLLSSADPALASRPPPISDMFTSGRRLSRLTVTVDRDL